MNQYSLTEATSIFEKHYYLKYQEIKDNKDILNYNNHKIRHTYAVLFVCQKIITGEKEIFNNNKKIKKAEIASLLHDIARFYQNNGERILTNKEFEHGDIGYEILKKEGYTDLAILFAVKYHNKLNINDLYNEKDFKKCSETEKEEIIDIVNIVRDADKLQNLQYMIFSGYNRLYFGYTEGKVSKEVLEQFLNKELTNNKFAKTKLDNIINLASWIFDLNFQTTKKELKNSNFVEFIIKGVHDFGMEKENIEKVKNILISNM